MLSCQYRHSNYKDKTVSRPSYLYNGNTNTLKESLYIETEPWWLSNTEQYGITIASLSKGVAGDTVMLSTQTFAYFIKGTHMLPRLDQAKFHIDWTANNWITAAGTQVTLYVCFPLLLVPSTSAILSETWLCFYQTRSAWSRDQGSNKNHSPAYNFAPTVTKFCVMWEGLSLPHDTKFSNCRCKLWTAECFLFDPWSTWIKLIWFDKSRARVEVSNHRYNIKSIIMVEFVIHFVFAVNLNPPHHFDMLCIYVEWSFHNKYKMIIRLSYIYNYNSYTVKTTSLYWDGPLVPLEKKYY